MIKRGPHIHTNGLTYYIDAANPKSYISGSSTTFNMLDTTQTGSFTNDIGATDNGGKSSFVFGLDGIDDTIKLNSRFAQTGQTDITISIWFKTTGDGVSGYNGLMNEISTTNPKRCRIIVKNDGNQIFYTINSTQRIATLSSTIPDNTWTNLTLAKDSSVGSKLYINSIFEYGNSGDTGTIAGVSSAASFPGAILGIGAESVYFMNGEISNVIVYDRALSPKEISQNYNALKGRFN
mgnify:CR=1 FL=1|tara:strand:+ start:877 stop:1584 length:708 start_codon:yes stop_codon:yes gene_type:complete